MAIDIATDTTAGIAQTVPTSAHMTNATVGEVTMDDTTVTAARPGADGGCSQLRDCMHTDNLPLRRRQHSGNTQPSLNARHSAHGEETTARSVRHRELVQPKDGHTSEDNYQQLRCKSIFAVYKYSRIAVHGLPSLTMHLK